MDEPTRTTVALEEFNTFLNGHRCCDDLIAGVEEPEFGQQRVWATRSCGASLSRNIRTNKNSVH